jgi:hypothetical protein
MHSKPIYLQAKEVHKNCINGNKICQKKTDSTFLSNIQIHNLVFSQYFQLKRLNSFEYILLHYDIWLNMNQTCRERKIPKQVTNTRVNNFLLTITIFPQSRLKFKIRSSTHNQNYIVTCWHINQHFCQKTK